MQFVADGPEIPDGLLQAQEEGRVVFFCGAGVSYPAGLPDFHGLVNCIYEELGTTPNAIEKQVFERSQFDATLDLLERRLPGDRLAMRKTLQKILKPKVRRKRALDTHAALLDLARTRTGAMRLITTNFDQAFEVTLRRNGQKCNKYMAPMLPIPKNSRWDGLVYLHGLLPTNADDGALRRLVLTSGDFGLAYLTERWASRFVTELFRYYTVCFVGYRIADPVLRYMMDALAADRRLGEVAPEAYALADCTPGEETKKSDEWRAKGVTPILYDPSNNHAALHATLKVWAQTWRDGILGRENIVVEYAIARPSASTRQDDFVGRMLWALSHESGLPAKRFADFNPVPSVDWLEAFSDARFVHSDLPRFAVPARSKVDDKLRFSLVRRPAPYDLAPWMQLASHGSMHGDMDAVMFHIAQWLTRHLNDPKVILWIARSGGWLHDRFLWLIEAQLDRILTLEREGKNAELVELRGDARNAIPSAIMRTLWRLLLAGRVKALTREPDLYRWQARLKREGLTTTFRLELRELLTPKVAISEPFRRSEEGTTDEEPTRLSQIVRAELVLAADHVHHTIRDISDAAWQEALPKLFDDLQQLLRDALDLLRELGEADDLSDRSHWDLPSISPHWQNRGFSDWVTLIELLRDSWLAVRKKEPARATSIAHVWIEAKYPTFKRLALYAAAQDGCVASDQWVEWLVSNDAWWLWSVETKRETLRLLVQQGAHLTAHAQARLEAAILTGPARKMFRDELGDVKWQALVDREVWLLLAKLNASGVVLGPDADQQLKALSATHPRWQLATNERDEFSHWSSGTGDPDYEDSRQVEKAPRKRRELVEWLKKPPNERFPFYEDTWREVCLTRFFHSWAALCDLSREQTWPTERWREALQAWSEVSRVRRAWRFVAPVMQSIPDDVLLQLAHSVSWWLSSASKSIELHEHVLLDLCRRVLALPLDPDAGIRRDGKLINEPVGEAINHSIGLATQALLNLWFKRRPSDNDGLPAEIEPIFTDLSDRRVEKFRHGRVLLASQLIALFRVDRRWTETRILPLFDWTTDVAEARAVWEGFLWSPRLYAPLLIAFKGHFLETAQHYADLGEHAGQFAAFITYAALQPPDGFNHDDFRAAVASLPQEGLREVAQALTQALEGSGDQREDYWTNRVQPFWHQVWPKSRELASGEIAELLVRLTIAAGQEFSSAVHAIEDWLQPTPHPDFIVHRLHESGLSAQFPNESLRVLDAIIDDQPWAPRHVGECLKAIAAAAPQLAQDSRHQRLAEYARKHRQ